MQGVFDEAGASSHLSTLRAASNSHMLTPTISQVPSSSSCGEMMWMERLMCLSLLSSVCVMLAHLCV